MIELDEHSKETVKRLSSKNIQKRVHRDLKVIGQEQILKNKIWNACLTVAGLFIVFLFGFFCGVLKMADADNFIKRTNSEMTVKHNEIDYKLVPLNQFTNTK